MHRQTSRSLGAVDFTYDWYRTFLDRLDDANFTFRTFSDPIGSGDALLRHDVDLSVEKALTTARIEAERGISATYCVLITSALYNPLDCEYRDMIRAIEALGHEVALHFSTHEYWDRENAPDKETLTDRVFEEQRILDTILSEDPGTVSFHVPPSWVLDREFEAFRNTYSPAYFSNLNYVADSEQRWRESPPNLPEPPASVQIVTHPGLYGEAEGDFESRVDWAVSETCRHADRKAGLEFLEKVYEI